MEITKQLIFIGGAPGVGKSEVALELLGLLNNCVWLDADDIWKMNPFVVNSQTTKMTERNIQYLLKSYFECGFSYILFTWVLHCDHLVKKLLNGIRDHDFIFRHFTLICDENTLKERITKDIGRTTDLTLAMKRRKQALKVKSEKVNTIDMTSNHIANILKEKLDSDNSSS